MLLFWSALLLCLAGYTYSVWSLAKKYTGETTQERINWIRKKITIVGIGMVFVIGLTITIFHKPLGKTIWCAYKGYEHSVSTRFNWISGVCSYEGPNNTWIPITRLIGFPEGDKEKEVSDVQSDTNSH